tara:strand:+ start:900 stop:1778 length:879 start_codon:yes stop_codon:yes gene_type:complete
MKEILQSHPVANLKKEISKTNIKGYSKMKKAELISLMLKNKSRFSHIKMYEKKARVKAPPKKAPPKKTTTQAKQTKAPVKKFNVKNKGKPRVIEPKSIGKSITGLTKEQMNKLDPAELFGLLPHNVRKQVLNPKKTGVKLGKYPPQHFKDKLSLSPDYDQAYEEMYYHLTEASDRTKEEAFKELDDPKVLPYRFPNPDVKPLTKLSEKQKKFFERETAKDPDGDHIDFSSNKYLKFERIQQKVKNLIEVVGVPNRENRAIRMWISKNKGKTFNDREAEESFHEFYFEDLYSK